MKLLDRFRSQPEWQSQDPAVRAAAVRDLSSADNEQELLIEIARHDDDPSVRLEAVLRLEDVDALASIVKDESDTTVRGEAEGALRDLVIEAEDPSAGEVGLSAVSNERDLVAVARSARLESVSRVALSRLKDPRAIGSVARRATRGEIAHEALSRLDDGAEILAVTVKADEKAIAVQAFERLSAGHLNRDVLEQLSKRAKQKAVQRRAKAALAALDQALTDPVPDQHTAVCEALEAMAVETDLDQGRAKLDRLLAEWSALDASSDSSLVQRFASAREGAEARLAEIESAKAAERSVREVQGQALSARDEICRRVQSLSGSVPPETVQQLRDEWAALPGDPAGSGSAADAESLTHQLGALDQRFERALAALEERQRQIREFQLRLAEVERVIAEMEAMAAIENPTTSKEEWAALDGALERQLGQSADRSWHRFASSHSGHTDGTQSDRSHQPDKPDQRDRTKAVEVLRGRYDAVRERRRALSAEARAKQDRKEQETLAQLLQRCRTVEGLVSSEKLRLVEAERQLRAVRRLIDDPGSIPRRERESVTRKLRHAHTGLLGRVRELRDFADWQRWANLGIQEELCRRMEALAETPDGDDVGLTGHFQEIMAKWRQASDVPKDRGAELWERFKAAHDGVYPRCQKFFEAQETLREQNLVRQHAIVDESERQASSTDWLRSLRRITDLQAEWKALKPVPRREQKELWKRFRTASNTFFSRRKIDLAERKKEWSKNLALKEALCARVIGLAETEDLEAAVADAKRAQAEWKTIGPVRRNRSDVLWQQFRAACDAVFDRIHAKERADAGARAAVREALCAEAESWLAADADTADDGLAEKIRDLQQRWREAPEVPQAFSRKLTARFGQAVARLVEAHPEAFRGTDLDPARKLKRLEKLCERVEALKPIDALGQEGAASPAEILATKWRDALASNLMGARVDEAAERRSALDQVKRAKIDCHRHGNLTGDEGRQLLTRFHAACEQVESWAAPKGPQRSSKDLTTGRTSAVGSGSG